MNFISGFRMHIILSLETWCEIVLAMNFHQVIFHMSFHSHYLLFWCKRPTPHAFKNEIVILAQKKEPIYYFQWHSRMKKNQLHQKYSHFFI